MDNFDIHEWKRNQLLELLEQSDDYYPEMPSRGTAWDYYKDKFKWWLNQQKEKLQRVSGLRTAPLNFNPGQYFTAWY